jgi:hypothetical protein
MILYATKVLLFLLRDTTLTLLDEIVAVPIITYKRAEQILNVTPRAARQNVDKLVESGLLREISGCERYKMFLASEIIAILEEETR